MWEPAFANAYIEYDPDRSKELLDEMGLKDTNGDGWRERSDGETLSFTIEFPQSGGIGVTNDLVTAYWQEIGRAGRVCHALFRRGGVGEDIKVNRE